MDCCIISKGRDLGRGVLIYEVACEVRVVDDGHVKQVRHHRKDEQGEQAALSGARIDVACFFRKHAIDPDLGIDLVLLLHCVHRGLEPGWPP